MGRGREIKEEGERGEIIITTDYRVTTTDAWDN